MCEPAKTAFIGSRRPVGASADGFVMSFDGLPDENSSVFPKSGRISDLPVNSKVVSKFPVSSSVPAEIPKSRFLQSAESIERSTIENNGPPPAS